MNYPTYADMKAKLQNDLDLQDEEMIQPAEMLAYFNDAVREAESEILGIYEDYFLAQTDIPLTEGVDLYPLPDNIYATKIRGLVYHNGPLIYPVSRIRDWKKFITMVTADYYTNTTQDYRYMIMNPSAADGVQLKLVPPSRETSVDHLTLWYIREANRLVYDTDVCDIPEFVSFIYAHVKVSCRKKEFNGFCPQEDRDQLEFQRKLMVDSLTAMVPDADTEIEKDLSSYYDQTDFFQ